jgi:hypothetical protein
VSACALFDTERVPAPVLRSSPSTPGASANAWLREASYPAEFTVRPAAPSSAWSKFSSSMTEDETLVAQRVPPSATNVDQPPEPPLTLLAMSCPPVISRRPVPLLEPTST